MKLTEKKFKNLMDGDSTSWDGDNAMQGLLIMARYLSIDKHSLIQGAGHDVILGPNMDELIEAGITEADVIKLRELNWVIEDGTYLACFV